MRKIFLLCLLGAHFLLHAQEPVLYFEKLSTQNGLSHNKVNSIIQDKRGFIWLGTDDRLNRYDGKKEEHILSKCHPHHETFNYNKDASKSGLLLRLCCVYKHFKMPANSMGQLF